MSIFDQLTKLEEVRSEREEVGRSYIVNVEVFVPSKVMAMQYQERKKEKDPIWSGSKWGPEEGKKEGREEGHGFFSIGENRITKRLG